VVRDNTLASRDIPRVNYRHLKPFIPTIRRENPRQER
jgi:hypothetical protein